MKKCPQCGCPEYPGEPQHDNDCPSLEVEFIIPDRPVKRLHPDSEVVALKARVAELERSETNLIDQRDRAEEWADQLAQGIVNHIYSNTGVIPQIGEHSSANNPWANALEAINNQAA